MIALVRTSGERRGPPARPVAAAHRPVDARHHGAADRGPDRRPPLQRGVLRRRRAAARGADRRRGLGLGAGDRRARLRAQRSGAAVFEHRAVRRLARSTCARRTPTTTRRSRWPAASSRTLATLRAMSVAVTARVGAGDSPMTEASLVKDLGTELEQFMPAAIADAIARACRGHDVAADAAADARLRHPVRADLLAARRHARDAARHDRARTGAAMNELADALRPPARRRLSAGPVRAIETAAAAADGAAVARHRDVGLPRRARSRSRRRRRAAPGRRVRAVRRRRPPRAAAAGGAHPARARAARDGRHRGAATGRSPSPARPHVALPTAPIACPRATPYGRVADWVVVASGTTAGACCPSAAPSGSRRGVHGSLRADLRWAAPPADAIDVPQAARLAPRPAPPSPRRSSPARCSASLRHDRRPSPTSGSSSAARSASSRRSSTSSRSWPSTSPPRTWRAEIGCAGAGPLPDPLRAAARQVAHQRGGGARDVDRARGARRDRHHRRARPAALHAPPARMARRLRRRDALEPHPRPRPAGRRRRALALDFMRAALIPRNEDIRP